MRLFVAMYPARDALDHLEAALGELRLGRATAAGHNVRLVARPLWHVTLAFLGELPDDSAAGVAAALADGVTRWRGTDPAPVLRLAGGGRFGGRRAATVWVGLAGDLGELRSLGGAVRRALRRARFPYDRKPLRPHLTIARPGERLPATDLAADIAALGRYEGPQWTAEAVHLVRSRLGPKPVHERIATIPLGRDNVVR